jgi:hypothetical protein
VDVTNANTGGCCSGILTWVEGEEEEEEEEKGGREKEKRNRERRIHYNKSDFVSLFLLLVLF